MLAGDDLAVVHHQVRAGTWTVRGDGPAVLEGAGEHGRHLSGEGQFLAQPTGGHVLDQHRRPVVHQPQRAVIDPGETHAVAADELVEPVRRREHRVVAGGGEAACEGDEGLHVAAGAQRHDQNFHRTPPWRSW